MRWGPRTISLKRGNYQQKIFTNDADRIKYLYLLKEESSCYHLIILSYCLMSNHVHFMAFPQSEDSLGKVFKYTHMKYSQYYNNRMKVSGHFFQNRFFSCVLDERHMIACAQRKDQNRQPLGTSDFVERLEGQLKRFLKLKPKGRPKKKADK